MDDVRFEAKKEDLSRLGEDIQGDNHDFHQRTTPLLATSSNSTSKMVAGVFAGTVIMSSLALTAPFVFSKSSLPYMATPSRKIAKALQYLVKHEKKKQQQGVFVDMGSGDGEGVYQAMIFQKQQYFVSAIGIELNFTLFLLSQIRKFFWTSHQKQRSRFVWGNMFSLAPHVLPQADTVLIFGIQPLMPMISQTLAQHCVPGTHILAYRFTLPLLLQQHQDNNSTKNDAASSFLHAKLIYDEEEMRIYECLSPPQKS